MIDLCILTEIRNGCSQFAKMIGQMSPKPVDPRTLVGHIVTLVFCRKSQDLFTCYNINSSPIGADMKLTFYHVLFYNCSWSCIIA